MRGSLERRGKSSWRARISTGWDPVKRKYGRKSITIKARTKKEAEAKRTELLYAENRGELPEPSKLTFGQYLDQWLDSFMSTSERSKEWYRMVVNKHIKPKLGNIPIQKLAPIHIQNYFKEAMKINSKGKKLSWNTLHGHYRVLHSALEQAVKMDIIARNPASKIQPPPRERGKVKALPPEDILKLLETAKPYRYYALFLGAIATGMREGELLGLCWRNVDLDKGLAYVEQELLRGGRKPVFKRPKTDSSIRTVTLPPVFIEALKEVKQRQEEEKAACKTIGERYADLDLVFATASGWPISRTDVNDSLDAILKKAGLPHFRFHSLRHSHATWLIMEGVDIRTVSERLGHSSPNITLELYSHVLEQMKDKPAQIINNILNKKGAE